MKKKYTEKDLKNAYDEGFKRGLSIERSQSSWYAEGLTFDEYIESLKPQPKEEKEIPITYGLIKATCGWSKFAEVTDKNVYAINEFGDYEDREVFYITESQAKQLNFI